MLLIAAGPFVENAYKFFDQSAPLVSGYWNAYFFLYAVGTDISVLLWATAFFLFMPENNPMRMFSLVPAAYKAAHLFWVPFATDNVSYHQNVPFALLMIGVAFSLAWFAVVEYLVDLYCHKRTRPVATMEGAAKCPHISEAQLRSIVITETQVLKALK